MPVKHEIIYQSTSTPAVCGEGNTVEVHLVQDSVAKHPDAGSTSEYVAFVNVYYDANSDQEFVLTLLSASFVPGDIRRVVSEGDDEDAAAHGAPVPISGGWEVHFSEPRATPSTATFYFGVGAPPDKIKVKIKKQEDEYRCP